MKKWATLVAALVVSAATIAAAADITPLPFVEPPRQTGAFKATLEKYPSRVELSAPAAPITAVPGMERQKSISGAQYTVISPLYFASDNNYSYLRFSNITDAAASFRATLVGSPSTRNYGTVTVTVAPYASPQYSIQDLFKALEIVGPDPKDTNLSLYVQSPQGGQGVGFQHVVWNSVTGFFENQSVCTYAPWVDYSVLNRALINVHTTQIADYPAVVYLHNYAGFAVTYKVDVFKAVTGSYLGSFNFNLGANDAASEQVSDIEKIVGYSPPFGEGHINLLFTPQITPFFYGLAVQSINNLRLNSLTNMSAACSVNP